MDVNFIIGYYVPKINRKEQYFPSTARNIYSHSKSFTSLMVGIAIDENMLSLDTRLVDVFKDELDKEDAASSQIILIPDVDSLKKIMESLGLGDI